MSPLSEVIKSACELYVLPTVMSQIWKNISFCIPHDRVSFQVPIKAGFLNFLESFDEQSVELKTNALIYSRVGGDFFSTREYYKSSLLVNYKSSIFLNEKHNKLYTTV